jgi:hypothetical protein
MFCFRFNYLYLIRVFITVVVINLFGSSPESIIRAATPVSASRKISGDSEALKILKQLKANECSSLSIVCEFTLEINYLAATSEPVIRGNKVDIEVYKPGKKIISVDWAIQQEKIRFSYKMHDDRVTPHVEPNFVAAWDGNKGQMYIASSKLANLYGEKSKLLSEYNTNDPRGFSLFYYSISASIDIEGGDFKVLHEQKDGRELVVLTQKSQYRTLEYWLNPINKLIPEKILEYSKDSNKIESETIISDSTLCKNGTWFIKESTTNFPKENRKVSFHTNKLSFEEIPADFFNIDIPEKTLVYDTVSENRYLAQAVYHSLIGKSLPDFNNLGLISYQGTNDKIIMVCFFDYEQRPSRNCLTQLNTRAQKLKSKNIEIIAVQTSKIDKATLDKWVKENNISFPVGMIEKDEEQTRLNWGVKSLPWLILTDKQHKVIDEGFAVTELEEKIKS